MSSRAQAAVVGVYACDVRGLALAYGLQHALVDASCAALLIHQRAVGMMDPLTVYLLLFVYNGLAFGLQFFVGFVADRGGRYRPCMLASYPLLAIGLLLGDLVPTLAVMLVGVGNALFHVGAGAAILRLSPERSSEAGLFVAPGALGLAIGAVYGNTPALNITPFLLLLLLSAVATFGLGAPESATPAPMLAVAAGREDLATLAVGALLGSVAIRALVGTAIGLAYRVEPSVLPWLALAAFLGKATGGLLADRVGWVRASVGALLLSAPLLSFLSGIPALAVVGMLLFQMTMPVTLLAVYRALPQQAGLAFGLPCLALLLGTLPAFIVPSAWLTGPLLALVLTLVSAAALLLGLPAVLRGGSAQARPEPIARAAT